MKKHTKNRFFPVFLVLELIQAITQVVSLLVIENFVMPLLNSKIYFENYLKRTIVENEISFKLTLADTNYNQNQKDTILSN